MKPTTGNQSLFGIAAVAAVIAMASPRADAQAPLPPTNTRIVDSSSGTLAQPAPTRLKVVTFNIGSGNDWKDADIPYEAIARHILDQAPDVVLLQEVHDRYIDTRGPRFNQPQYWRTRLGMTGSYLITSKAYDFWGQPQGTAGDMVLSRYPIVQVDEDQHPFDRGIDFWPRFIFMGAKQSPRSKMSAVIDVRGTRVRLASVHLPGDVPEPTLEYLAWLDRFPEPTIVGGDFNRGWDSMLQADDSFKRSILGRFDVVPNHGTPAERRCGGVIDWILVRHGQVKLAGKGGYGIGGYGKVAGECPITDPYDPARSLSDHPLVYGTAEIEPVPIFNPGFENGLNGWNAWSPDATYRAGVVPGGHSGTSAAIQYNAAGFIFRDLPVSSGQEYEISAQVVCGFGTAQGKLSVHDTAGGLYEETAYSCNMQQWSELRLRYRANGTSRVRVHFYRGDGSGVVAWDSLVVRPVAP
jgi:endonuclease/exonuclease/phosphatase family metal-dependent hydrolase